MQNQNITEIEDENVFDEYEVYNTEYEPKCEQFTVNYVNYSPVKITFRADGKEYRNGLCITQWARKQELLYPGYIDQLLQEKYNQKIKDKTTKIMLMQQQKLDEIKKEAIYQAKLKDYKRNYNLIIKPHRIQNMPQLTKNELFEMQIIEIQANPQLSPQQKTKMIQFLKSQMK